jgi:hypothetical protein
MTASLPDNAELHLRGTEAATVPSLLQEMRAGAAALFVRPLLLGNVVEYMREHPLLGGGPGPRVDEETLNEWLQTAHAVESAHRTTLAWLRSRLPGYPILRVPQLAPDTHLTTQFFTASIVWLPTERAEGHQFDAAPRDVPEQLGATPTQATALYVGARQLADGLKATPEWDALNTARQQLTEADRTALMAAKRSVRGRLAAIDDSDPDIFQRDAFRRQQVREAIEELDGSPRTYCEAFDAINSLIEIAVGDAFGQLVAYGDPKTEVASNVDFPEPGIVHVATKDPFGHYPGDLIRIDDPLVTDALRVEGSVSQINLLDLKPSTLTLRILDGTSVWFPGH